MKPIKMFDVFSGMGGAVEAARGLPIKSIGGCEYEPNAATVYWSTHGHYPFGNIWEVDPSKIEPFDLLFVDRAIRQDRARFEHPDQFGERFGAAVVRRRRRENQGIGS